MSKNKQKDEGGEEMFCKKCGKELDETVRFCPQCGTPVSEKDVPRGNKNENFWLRFIWGGCVIVLVGIAGFTSWKVRKIHTETLTAEESTLEEGTETENLVLESAEETLTLENAPEETEASTQETEAIDLREGLSGRFAEDNDDYRWWKNNPEEGMTVDDLDWQFFDIDVEENEFWFSIGKGKWEKSGTYGNQIEWKDDRNAVLTDQFDSQYNLQIIDENTLIIDGTKFVRDE